MKLLTDLLNTCSSEEQRVAMATEMGIKAHALGYSIHYDPFRNRAEGALSAAWQDGWFSGSDSDDREAL
ncbi:hypothetical protein [Vibrio mediterranei]|uniref:hypothetical protein n=1 Tax=Vibrio mediterranei TaxID=689 RepID=UPI004067FBC4